MKHLRVIANLILIHRSLRGVLAGYLGWRAGKVQVWDLSGQIVR